MEINNNPQRYTKTGNGWEISAVNDSPNKNPKGEIKPITITKGTTPFTILPLLGVNDIVVEIDGNYLVSSNTLRDIQSFGNPHWDIIANGSIPIGIRSATIGKTIPVIKIDETKWGDVGIRRDTLNRNAGVTEVDYIYEGKEVSEGITQGLINQINYTLGEYSRPGDSFSYYKYAEDKDPKYDITALTIAAAQEDGPIDQTKLDTFLLNIDERLTQLSNDFNSIKRTFFYGELPNTSGKRLIRVENKIASSNDESPIVEHQYVEKTSNTTTIQTSRINAAIEATKTPPPTTTPSLNRIPRTLTDFENEEKKKWEDSVDARKNPLSRIAKGLTLVWKGRAKKRYDDAKLAGTL